MQELIQVTEKITAIRENVTTTCTVENIASPKQNLKAYVAEYDQFVKQIIAEQEKVIKLQKEIISTGSFLGGLLTISERSCIQKKKWIMQKTY